MSQSLRVANFTENPGNDGARGASYREAVVAPQETEEEVASYLFDLLVGARRLAVARRHRFLAYLIGMAAEEARLLTQGRSANR